MTGEGSLDAPTRHVIDWQDPDFADPVKLDEEMRRVFDICHGCRRCFNLCDSFPRLFDLIDTSPKEDVEHLKSEDFKPVVEACTLCDMCFMTKCPYVPPHPFNAGFPAPDAARTVLSKPRRASKRFRAAATGRDGPQRHPGPARVAPLVNWASDKANKPMRGRDGKDRRHRPPRPPCRNSMPALLSARPSSETIDAQHGRAGLRQAQGRALCHLLRQLQQARHRHGGARRAQSYRGRNQSRLSRLLRHAVPGTGRAGRAWRRTPPRSPRNWSS